MSTAEAMLAMLRRHYLPEGRPDGGVFAAEIESPDGKRRADAIWMPTTWSGARELIGHEIKVTRSDVLTELADPTKHDAWARYCHRWWLVVLSPALVEGLDVPEHWGILSPPSGRRTRTMTVVRPAPKLTPIEAGAGFRRVAVWLANSQRDARSNLAYQLQDAQRQLAQANRKIDELRATAGTRVDPKAVELQRILRAVDQAKRERHLYVDLDEAEVIAALVDLAAVRSACESARWDLERIVRSARDITEPMGRIAADLAKLTSPAVTVELTA